MSGRWSLALVVIARDEAQHIERLLRSVAPFVDRMWLLDTGSVDATPALAAACGAQVAHAPWPDDFAVARNLALARAAADWHLVLDADEWLIEGGEVLAALRRQAPDFVGSLALEDRFFDGGRGQVSHTRLSRVLPGAVRYAGAVHEQPQHRLQVRPLAIRIGHDGYLPEALARKRGRNRRLLQAAVARAPDDAYLWYQLGKDATAYDEHSLAERAYARCAALDPPDAGWWIDLVVRRLHGLKRLQRHADGMDWADSQMARCQASPDFFFALGDLLLDLAAEQPQQATGLLPMIEQAWRQCLALGERPDLPGAVAGRGSGLAAHNLALVLDVIGRADEAAVWRAVAAPSAAT